MVLEKIRLWEENSKQYTGALHEFREQPELLNRLVQLFSPSSLTVEDVKNQITDFYRAVLVQEPVLKVVAAAACVTREVKQVLVEFLDRLECTGPYCQPGEMGPMLEEVRINHHLEKLVLYKPLRLALTGSVDGPEISGVLAVIGIERTIKRVKKLLETSNGKNAVKE